MDSSRDFAEPGGKVKIEISLEAHFLLAKLEKSWKHELMKPMSKNLDIQKKAMTVARRAQKNSHSPYSKKKIGAAIVLSNGQILGGCNIENASYGGTVCAERVAIWKAKSEFPTAHIKLICVVSPGNPPWPPCGFCRQVMAEFCEPKTKVICFNDKNQQTVFTLAELLPNQFSAKDL